MKANKYLYGRLLFSRIVALNNTLGMPVTFSPVEYRVSDVQIDENSISFCANGKFFFRGVNCKDKGIIINELIPA